MFQHSSPSTLATLLQTVLSLHKLRFASALTRPDSCCSFCLVAGGGGAFGGLLLLSSVTVVFSPPFNPLSHALIGPPFPKQHVWNVTHFATNIDTPAKVKTTTPAHPTSIHVAHTACFTQFGSCTQSACEDVNYICMKVPNTRH